MSDTALSIQDLSVRYGAVEALKGITIEVPAGSIVALLGANGAGKTSTMRSISGLVPKTRGKVSLFGADITKYSPEKIASLGISQSPEGRQIFRELTVKENLLIGAFVLKNRKQEAACFERVFGIFPLLKERLNQVAVTLSGGELQMLAIGRALMSSPKVLLLDEPSLGLAPLVVRDMFNVIKAIREEGTTILIVEQNALQTLKIADYAYVLTVGKITTQGKASELIKDKALVDAYLGGH
ncbi:MAG: ABC transporter ATP-binding protein [Spirochaetaceae bacterium]|jgi:branched-chain amino acid transport system ATP-binding protein|nr:ABC transporter ATP-binding protein [Spirochaetaceae bacterium]